MTNKKTRKQKKEEKKKNRDQFGKYMITVIPLTIAITLIIFTVIQYLGEILNVLPIIYLSDNTIFTSGENIIVFILTLAISMMLGLIISYRLRKIFS